MDRTKIGLKGSPTIVGKTWVPGIEKSQLRTCLAADTPQAAARKLVEKLWSGQQDRAARLEGGGRKIERASRKKRKGRPVKAAQDEAMPDWSAYRGVMVYVEQREAWPNRYLGSCSVRAGNWPTNWMRR